MAQFLDLVHNIISMEKQSIVIEPIYLMPYIAKEGTKFYEVTFFNRTTWNRNGKNPPYLFSMFVHEKGMIREVIKVKLKEFKNTRRSKYKSLYDFYRNRYYQAWWTDHYRFYYDFPEDLLRSCLSTYKLEELKQKVKDANNRS